MFVKFDAGGGQNFALVWVYDFFLAQNFVKCPLATITTTNNLVSRFPEGKTRDAFWQIITDKDVLLFLRGERTHRNPPTQATE